MLGLILISSKNKSKFEAGGFFKIHPLFIFVKFSRVIYKLKKKEYNKNSQEVCDMNLMNVSAIRNQQKQALIRKNYREIYTHELAHKNAGGSLAGAIVIERNSEGIPVSGHVSIKMPSLNKQNPDETINQADTVIKSAMAPSDPSGQDYRVASQARAIKSKAQGLQHSDGNKKGLDYYA